MFLIGWKFAGFIIFIILFIYKNEPRFAYLGSFFLWVCRPFFVNFMFLMCLTAHYTYFSSLESGLNRAFWKILMQKNTNLVSCFHLEAVESVLSLWNCVLCHCWYTSLNDICKGVCCTKTLSPLQNITFTLQVYFVYHIHFYNWKIFTIIINKFECKKHSFWLIYWHKNIRMIRWI